MRLAPTLRKLLLVSHRWLGIAGCVLFIAWFFSGIVMMYARMPQLLPAEQLARAPRLAVEAITVPLATAVEHYFPSTDRIRVGMIGPRPVYRFGNRNQLVVYADDGELFTGHTTDAALAVARTFLGDGAPALRYDEHLEAPDQWTIGMTALLPLHRLQLDDAAGTVLYVSDVTGQVELRTTRRERLWGYLGPVTHWVYFAPFRRSGSTWYQFIVWSSLIGCVMCVLGLAAGIVRYSRRGFRMRGGVQHSPYTGLMRWHHYAGLAFGTVALTWAYSGLLSVEPFDWFPRPGITPAQEEAVTGGDTPLAALTLDSLRLAAATLGAAFPVKELEVVPFRGEAYWAAERAPHGVEVERWMHAGLLPRTPLPRLERRLVSARRPGEGTFDRFPREPFDAVAREAMPGVAIRDAVWLDAYDGYYYDARSSRTLPVLRVRYADADETWLYFDPRAGAIAQHSSRVSRTRRWLYQGLHSLDFPFLYFRRPLWDVVVILLSLGGLISSGTALVPAWRRIVRNLRHAVSAPRRFLAPRLQRLRG